MNVCINALDNMGSLLWSNNGGKSQDFAYSPFGSTSARNGSDSLLVGFNGGRLDPVNQTYHLGNGYRTYNPTLMRFNAPDSWSPFGSGGLNQYAYCEGDPINRSDPSGHMSVGSAVKAGLGILLGILGIVFSDGAATPAVVAAMVLGGASLVTGVASAATSESDPQLSADLGWTSLALGIASAVAGGIGGVHERMAKGIAVDDLSRSGLRDNDARAGNEPPRKRRRIVDSDHKYYGSEDYKKFREAGVFSPYENGTGGRVWLSEYAVGGSDVIKPLEEAEREERNAVILTGTHGSRVGVRAAENKERKFFVHDSKRFANGKAVRVRDINDLTSTQLKGILHGTDDVIVAFCYSRNDIALRRILGLPESRYYFPFDGPRAASMYL